MGHSLLTKTPTAAPTAALEHEFACRASAEVGAAAMCVLFMQGFVT